MLGKYWHCQYQGWSAYETYEESVVSLRCASCPESFGKPVKCYGPTSYKKYWKKQFNDDPKIQMIHEQMGMKPKNYRSQWWFQKLKYFFRLFGNHYIETYYIGILKQLTKRR
jgi:hypothetical protein